MSLGNKAAIEVTMPKKKLGICIPTWNRGELLKQCVESVLPQLTDQTRLVVLDNASTDQSQAYLSSLGDTITYVRHPENQGYIGNFQACVAQSAQFDWIAILHSDDIYSENAVPAAVAAIDAHPTSGLIFSSSHQIDSDGNLIHSGTVLKHSVVSSRGTIAVQRCQSQIPCSSTIYNSLAIQQAGLPSGRYQYSADEEYNARIARNWDIVQIPTILSSYRHHPQHTMRETWRSPDFIASFTNMRIQMNSYLELSEQVSESEVRWQTAAMLLGHCSYLDALGDTSTSDQFYRHAIATDRKRFFSRPKAVARWLIHKTPGLNRFLARRLSKSYSH